MAHSKGFSLIEIMLGIAVFALLATAVIGSLSFAKESRFVSGALTRAVDINREGLEAVRNIKGENFLRLVGGVYGLSTTTNRWNLTLSPEVVDDFYTRTIGIEEIDSFRRKISATTTWSVSDVRQVNVAFITYFTNWARSVSSWANAALEAAFDLTSDNSGVAGANSISIAFRDPYVFLGRANSAGSELYVFDASTTTSPALLGQIALNGDPNDLAVSGNYVFIASTDNAADLQVVDVSDPSAPTLATSTALTVGNSGNDTANGNAVTVSGNHLYYVRAASAGREFIVFDISIPNVPVLVGQLDLSGTPNELTALGNYAYVATTDLSEELQIIDITTPSSPAAFGTFDLNSGNNGPDALSLVLNGSTLYMGRISTAAAPEFYILDVSTPSAPSLISTLEIGSDVVSMDLATSTSPMPTIMLATSDTAGDFKVVDVSVPASPEAFVSLDITNLPQKIIYSSSRDRSFIASSADSQELQIIKPN